MKKTGPVSTIDGRRSAAIAACACLAVLSGAPQAALTRPAAAQGVQAADPPGTTAIGSRGWWLGFDDAALDLLIRAAVEQAAGSQEERAERVARVGTHYVTARWLAARLAVAHDLNLVLRKQRQWAAVEGPTTSAALTIGKLDRVSSSLGDQVASIADEFNQVIAELRLLSPLPPDTMEAVQGVLLSQRSVPTFVPPMRTSGTRQTLGELADANALVLQDSEVRRLERSGQVLSSRFEAARKSLETGFASEREVLQLYERLLLETDQVLKAKAVLAIGWVRVMSNHHR